MGDSPLAVLSGTSNSLVCCACKPDCTQFQNFLNPNSMTPVSYMVAATTLSLLGMQPLQQLQQREVVTSNRVESVALTQDTIPRRRSKAYEYSAGYTLRNSIHKTASWAMLPLFALSYASGDQILSKGSDAPRWARSLHRPSATATATLFTINGVTGGWNLWEGRHDPNGRTKRIFHSALFTVASAGFVYSGSTLAEQAESSHSKRIEHRNINIASMSVSTVGWIIMLIH